MKNNFPRSILLLFAIIAFPTSPICFGYGDPGLNLSSRVEKLEEQVESLESEIEVLKAQSKLVIQRTTIGFLDQFYLKGGLSLLLPRSRTFTGRVDTGLGAYVGGGRYFGRNHVLEATLDWDLYTSLTVKYRYEFHWDSPLFSIGPVLGYKHKVFDIMPFDNFLGTPGEVRPSFFILGASAGFPMTRSMAVLEALYLFNEQAILVGNVAVHFFF